MIKYIKASSYLKNIVTLMSGTILAQVVLLAIMPILTRIYTPTEFGAYSLYIAISSILGLVSSLKYDQAIMLPKHSKDAFSLLVLAVFITIFISIMLLVFIFLFDDFINVYFGGVVGFVWLIPMGVLLIGLVQVFSAYTSRHLFYKTIAGSRASNSISMAIVQVGSRSIFKFNGLILGKLIADSISLVILVRKLICENAFKYSSVSKRRLVVNARRYINFPKYESFTGFFNSISQNMPILLLGVFYSVDIAGFFALAIRALKAPVGLVGASTKEVFYQTASKRHAEGKPILDLYLKTTIGLGKLFIIPFALILIFGPSVFSYVFGEQWFETGLISQLLIFWVFFLFINSPTIAVFNILHLQKNILKIEIYSTFLRFLSLYFGYYFFNSYYVSIALFVCSSVIVNIYLMLFVYFKLKKNRGT